MIIGFAARWLFCANTDPITSAIALRRNRTITRTQTPLTSYFGDLPSSSTAFLLPLQCLDDRHSMWVVSSAQRMMRRMHSMLLRCNLPHSSPHSSAQPPDDTRLITSASRSQLYSTRISLRHPFASPPFLQHPFSSSDPIPKSAVYATIFGLTSTPLSRSNLLFILLYSIAPTRVLSTSCRAHHPTRPMRTFTRMKRANSRSSTPVRSTSTRSRATTLPGHRG